MEPMHLHGSMEVPPEVAPVYEMMKRRYMAAILADINCQLVQSEYRNTSPYWTVNSAVQLHGRQHDREVATTAFLDQYWETVRKSYTDLGVLCMPPFSLPLDFQRLVDESPRWQDSTRLPRLTFPPILVTYDGLGFHEYILAHAEVNSQPFPNYFTRDEGRNTLVFALADDQYNPSHAAPPTAPPQSMTQHRRRSLPRTTSVRSVRSSRATPSRPIPPRYSPPRPDTTKPDNMMPRPASGPAPYVDALAAALSAAKALLRYPESEPFRRELKTFIDLLMETRASEMRTRTALSNPKFLKRLDKFMKWYEDIESERTLGKKLLFKIEDQPRLREFFTKLTHIRNVEAAAERKLPVTSRQSLDLERVEQALHAFQDLVDNMGDVTNEPSVDV